jgi:HEAT repeat protein
VQELLRASDARSRAAGLDALARMPNQVAPATILGHFDDPAALVRAAAVRAAAARSMGELVAFCELLDDHSAEVRAAAVAALRARPDAVETLLEVLRSGTGRVQDGALAALDGHVDSARAELLAWSEEQVARATWLRGHVLVLASVDSDSPAAYLREVIARREADIEARLLTALGYLGAPEASGLIRRCLRAPDPEVRAQAIEALDSLGDARLARAVVRLLERDDDVQHRAPADVIATITDLGEDRDPWVRVLSLRTLSEHLRTKRQWLTTRVRDDPDPLVREAIQVGEAEDEVPEFPRLVSDIDRMLVLRRVSLFAALEPEDLQRVATDAREQSWAEGDELVTEGELGNELMVIVGGTVRVVHRQDGVEREVRTYGEGDHIGELAVLREAPRAATVVAAAGGVRGLVISGEAIGSLLRERPEAAAAMLATLAERISQQG